MKERWPWLAVLTAVLLTGFFLPDLSLAIQDRRAEGRTETRAVDSPVLVHKEEAEDIGFVLDDMELARYQSYLVVEPLPQGREMDFNEALSAARVFLESMAVYNLIPDEMARDVEVDLSPNLLCTEDARTAVVWFGWFLYDNVRVNLLLDDREGRLLAFNIENHLPVTDMTPEATAVLDSILRFCQENCAPLTCESGEGQTVSVEDDDLQLRTAFHLSDGTGRAIDAEVSVNQVGNGFSVYSFNW